MATSMEDLFRAHWGLVCGYLTRRTGDASLAEELAQETFYRATRAFLGWRGGPPAAWLLAIARNALIDAARKGARLVPLEEVPEDAPSMDQPMEIRDALTRLPPWAGRVLALTYLDGFSVAEIAAVSGSTSGAVKTALWRARALFRALYQEESDD